MVENDDKGSNATTVVWVTDVDRAGLFEFDDEALVAAYQGGVIEAADVLVSRHRPVVERICKGRLWDREAAEDATQETFVRCLKTLPHFVGGEQFGRYVKVAAVSVCRDAARRRRPAGVELRESATRQMVDHTIDVEGRCVDTLTVSTILAGLSPDDAHLLVEHHVRDRSIADLAVSEGSTISAVKTRLHRARKRARAIAEVHGLKGLLPLPWVPQWSRQAAERLATTRVELVAACLAAIPLVIGSVIAALPTTPTPGGPPGLAAPGAQLTEVVETRIGLAGEVAQASTPTDPRELATIQPSDAQGRGPAGSQRQAQSRSAAVAFAPVPIPVTGRTLTSSPPDGATPTYVFEVTTSADGHEVSAGVDVYDEHEAAAAHEAACTGARVTPGPVTCRRGASPS